MFAHKTAPWDARIQAILSEWHRTPYVLFRQAKGVGVDCVRFLTGVLDEMSGTVRDIDELPPDAAFNKPSKARAQMRKIIRIYNGRSLEPDEPMQSGDGIVAKTSRKGGPGHAIIVSAVPGIFYHATAAGIRRCGWFEVQRDYVGRFRSGDRSAW